MILNINKPQGWSSFDVVRKVRSDLNIKKVGHAGTLDPLATGVLIILTDKDTKKQEEIMSMEKEYVFEMALGVVSETFDLEGPLYAYSDGKQALTEGAGVSIDVGLSCIPQKDEVEEALTNYTGTILQKVPLYSATKYKGKSLYKYARQGKGDSVELPEKEVEIYALDLLDYREKYEFLIKGNKLELPFIKAKIRCGRGTYIRRFADDLGKDLNTGAVLTSLVRTRIGPYKLEEARNVADLSPLE